jgi:hypothetical protein
VRLIARLDVAIRALGSPEKLERQIASPVAFAPNRLRIRVPAQGFLNLQRLWVGIDEIAFDSAECDAFMFSDVAFPCPLEGLRVEKGGHLGWRGEYTGHSIPGLVDGRSWNLEVWLEGPEVGS